MGKVVLGRAPDQEIGPEVQDMDMYISMISLGYISITATASGRL
jgi:hypothetical protein